MTERDLREIRSSIDFLRSLDTKFKVSGSERHQYQFAGPLPEEAVLAFEKENRIRLPEDYRLFMTRLGPGAGPDPGVANLRKWGGRDLSMPFPFEQTMTYAGNPGLQEWEDALPLFPGMVALGYHGGTVSSELVVNGKAYGSVWLTEERGFFSLNQTFGEWYLDWLHWLKEMAVPVLIRDQISDQVHPGMTRSEVISLCGGIGGEYQEIRSGGEMYDLEFPNLLTKFRMTKNNVVRTNVVRSLNQRSAADDEKLFSA